MEGCLDTKLHETVRYGDTNLVESALKDDLDPNAIGLYQWSPLHEASSNGDLEIVRLLLQYQGDPNAKDHLHGCTAVHYAGREGHVDCLEALLENGGRHDVANNDGETGLDVAVDKCKEILDRKRTEELIKTSVKEKLRHNDNEDKVFRDVNPEKMGKDLVLSEREGSASPTCTSSIKSDTPTAWDAIQVQETNAEPIKDAGTGHLQLSFEYNSRTSIMKIRVWQLEDILLPPAEVANVTHLSVKSRLLPDKKGDSKRKTEDARLEDPAKMKTSLVSVKRKSAKDSFKAIYLPCTFLFTKPLEYKNVTKEIVESKTVHIDVNVKQKYSNKSFTVANLQLPMKEAVRKLRKRKYRLHPCINYSMPDNVHSYDPSDLVIVSEGMYTNKTVSNPNLRSSSAQSLKVEGEQRATSDINLQTVRCHSTESIPSVSLSIPDDDQTDHDALQAITVMNDSPRSMHVSHSNPEIHVVEIHEMNTLLPGTTDPDLSEVRVESPSLARISKSTPNIPVLQIEDLEGETPVKKLTRPTSPPNRLAVPPASYRRPRKQSSSSRPKQESLDPVNLRRNTKIQDSTNEPPRPGRAVPVSAVHKYLGSSNSYDVAKEMKSYSNPAGVFHISEREAIDRKTTIMSKVKDKKKEPKEGHHKLLRTFSDKEGIFSPVFQSDEAHSSNAEYSEISELSTAQAKLSASKFNKALSQKSEASDGKTSKTRPKKRDPHTPAVLPMSELTLSPKHIPEVQTVSETRFGNWKPGKHSTPKKISPRDQPSLERVDASPGSVAQSKRDRIPAQGFPQPLTHGLMHTDLNTPTSPKSLSPKSPTSPKSPDCLGSPEELNNSSHSSSPGSEARVIFLSETKNQDQRLRQTTPRRRIKSPTRETQARSLRNQDPVEFEMDPTFQKEMAKAEFKLKMFQRTSKDPHPTVPHVIISARKRQLLNSHEDLTDPFFILESPSGSPMVDGSVNHSSQRKVQSGKIDLHNDGRMQIKHGELRAVENQSVVRVKQSWL